MGNKWFGRGRAVLLAAGIIATGCGTASSTVPPAAVNDTVSRANRGLIERDDRPVPGGKLVYGLFGETNGWNPATNQWAPPGLEVTKAIFDTLTAYDEQSNVKPNLAESISPNADLTVWTMKLRPGVKLHNGKPVTADVVVRNQTFLSKSPVTGPAYRYAGITAFTRTDDLTLTITTSRPSAVVPAIFATQLGVVADPDWLESNDSLHPIGTGPFVFQTWDIGHNLVVKKNDDYWQVDADGARLPYLDSIEFRVITDIATRGNALQAADIDVLQTKAGAQVKDFQLLDRFQVLSDTNSESREHMVMLNTQQPPLDDPDVRRALAYATDRQAVNDTISGGFEQDAEGPFAPTSPWYKKTDYPSYDLAKARQLVDAAKARHGGKISFTLSGSEGAEQQSAQLLQQQWAQAGIDVTVELQEQSKLIIGVVTGSYQATLWEQFDAPSPLADGVWWDPDAAVAPPTFSLNFARNADPEIGTALKAANASTSDDVRRQQFGILQDRFAADIPYIWLTHQQVSVIASPRVVNLARNRLPDGSIGLTLNQGAHSLAQIWLADPGESGTR